MPSNPTSSTRRKAMRGWCWTRLGGLIVVAAFVLLLNVAVAPAAQFETLEITTSRGVEVFRVEIAKSDQERATGLMYRRELPEGQGMLFDFRPDQDVAMWMKNTFIALDMIFIRADGTIHHIAENTEPHSTAIISSQGKVRAVLEVIGGTVRKYGIARGDKVGHPLFGRP